MASRVLFQRRALAPLASLTLGAMALVPATALAEEPIVDKRKPIYDDFEASPAAATLPPAPASKLEKAADDAVETIQRHRKQRGPSPTDRLATEIGKARMFLYSCAVKVEDKVNESMDCAFNLEQSFTSTLASLAPARESGEKLMPGAIYVLVAAMAGSIVTRRSNILLRATVPLALGVTAGWSVLPVTMRNVSDLTWKYEQRFPAVAETHLKIRDSILKTASFAKVHSQIGVQYVDDKVTDAREVVEGWVKQGK